ncbi:MAG: hypothetical protein WD176_07670, partial [Pirellulales bacterium]
AKNATTAAADAAATTMAPAAVPSPATSVEVTAWKWVCQLLTIALAIVSWGSYGPVLHIGQSAMHHSRLRPLLCVGIAYFLIAVIVPNMILAEYHESSGYGNLGTLWALVGGAFGAVGALGIIMAFNFGGRPVFVMPLVFGGAPVINTLLASISMGKLGELDEWFLAGLILVIAGAAMVLIFAPRGDKVKEVIVEVPVPAKENGDGKSPPPTNP